MNGVDNMGIWVTDEYGFKIMTMNDGKRNEFIKDDNGIPTLGTGRSLITKLAASHWGYINKNGFLYDPDTIDGTLSTWTKPYPKPVLTYHPKSEDSQVDPIGRIIGSTYNTGVAREFIEDEVIPKNKPHGYIELLTRISDPDAISKVIDGRYDTVSISAIATQVKCSICGANVSTEDTECQHKRFKRYDKKGSHSEDGTLCYYKAGPLCGRHVAFVLTPSDIYAGVKEAKWEEDSIADSILPRLLLEVYVLSDSEKMMVSLNDEDSTNIFDEVNDSGKKTLIFDMMQFEPTIDDEIEEYIENILMSDKKLTQADRDKLADSVFCGPDRSFPVPDEEHARAALFMLGRSKMSSSEKDKVRSCVMDRIRRNGWKVSNDNINSDLQDTNNGGKEEGNTMKLEMKDTTDLTDKELDELSKDPEAMTEDAKLSYGARKNLPDSAFCGPDRSFPAQDAAHVRNGLARLNQSKGKAKGPILSCLRSRAKKYGIKVATKVKDDDESVEAVYDIMLSDANIEDILALEMVENYLEDNYKPKEDAGSNTGTNTGDATGDQATVVQGQSGASPNDSNTTTSDDKNGELQKSLANKEAEIGILNSRIVELTKVIKDSLVDRIVDMKKILNPSINIEDIRKELEARTEESLNDTLKDLRAESLTPNTPTTTITGKGINDNRDSGKINDKSNVAELKRMKYFGQLYQNK